VAPVPFGNVIRRIFTGRRKAASGVEVAPGGRERKNRIVRSSTYSRTQRRPICTVPLRNIIGRCVPNESEETANIQVAGIIDNSRANKAVVACAGNGAHADPVGVGEVGAVGGETKRGEEAQN